MRKWGWAGLFKGVQVTVRIKATRMLKVKMRVGRGVDTALCRREGWWRWGGGGCPITTFVLSIENYVTRYGITLFITHGLRCLSSMEGKDSDRACHEHHSLSVPHSAHVCA